MRDYHIDLKELALQVTTDPDHKFDLSLQLDDLDSALEIVRTIPDAEAETKWRAVGDRALAVWRFDLARECFERGGDLNALMLLLLSIGDREGLARLSVNAGIALLHFVPGPPVLNQNYNFQKRKVRITLRSLPDCN